MIHMSELKSGLTNKKGSDTGLKSSEKEAKQNKKSVFWEAKLLPVK